MMSDSELWLQRALVSLVARAPDRGADVEVVLEGVEGGENKSTTRRDLFRHCVFVGTSGQSETPRADGRRYWPVSVAAARGARDYDKTS